MGKGSESPPEMALSSETPAEQDGVKSGSFDFVLLVSSNIFFLMGSVLYLWLTAIGLDWAVDTKDIPGHLLEADDDWTWYSLGLGDDYVFTTRNDVWVSKAMILYFCAALCFVMTGVLDFVRHPGILAATFISAGLFGILSALFLEKNEHLSSVFNLVSVHLFFVEALQLLRFHNSVRGLKHWLRLADTMFVVATFTDVIISYIVVYGDFTIALASTGIASACLWLSCAIIYLGTTIYVRMHEGLDDPNQKGKKLFRTSTESTDNMDDEVGNEKEEEEEEELSWA